MRDCGAARSLASTAVVGAIGGGRRAALAAAIIGAVVIAVAMQAGSLLSGHKDKRGTQELYLK